MLAYFDGLGWTIQDPPKYYMVKCPCPLRHKRWIHLTPSNPRYANECIAWAQRCECSQEGWSA